MTNVYLITCIENNKKYVGITKHDIFKRFSMHCVPSMAKKSMLSAAIQKHGKHNFKVELITICNSVEEAGDLEKLLIEEINTKAPIGYNVHSGGAINKCTNFRNYKMNKKCIEAATLAKIGKPRSQETKDKISNSNKGKKVSYLYTKVLAINCKTGEEKIFESVTAASKFLNIHRNSIGNVLGGRTKTAGKHFFKEIK